MKLIVFGIGLLTCLPLSAQMVYPTYRDSLLHRPQVEIDGLGEMGASALKNEFTQTLLWGGTIDEGMKNRSFEHHGEVNRAGVNLSTEWRYLHGGGKFLKRDTLTWMVKAGYYALGNVAYGADVFGLVFYGNGAYLDDKAELTGTKLNAIRFQKVGFGVVNKRNHTSLTVNLVNVQDYMRGSIRKGELAQNEDGSLVTLDIQGDLKTTTGSNFNKGIGGAIDLDYRLKVPWINGKTEFQIMVQNVGFAYMFDGLKAYSADSTYSYSGFKFDQLTSGSTLFGDNFSLLDSLNISRSTIKRMVALPGYIQVMKTVELESLKKVQSFFGIRVYPFLSAVPLVFAGAYWKIANPLHLSGSVTYGGLTGIRGGLFVTLNLPALIWMIGTEDAFGLVAKSGYSKSIVTRLIWKFGN